MREIPIEHLSDFGIPKTAILCRRGDAWSVETDGTKAGSFISGTLRGTERLYAEPDGQLIASSEGGRTAAARITAIPSNVLDVSENFRALRNMSADESYRILLANSANRGMTVNLGKLISAAVTNQPSGQEGQIRPDRKTIWTHGPIKLEELAGDVCDSWTREALSRISDPSSLPEVDIPIGLTDEILDSAYRQTEGERPRYDELIHDFDFARSVVRKVFARDLESEAKFFDSSATDDVCAKLDGIDTAGCIVMLRNVKSGVCEYLFSSADSFTRVCPSSVGELVCDLASDSCSLGDDVQDVELSIDGGKLCLDEDPDRAHGDHKFEVLFIMKSVSDEVIAMDDAEIARKMSANRIRRSMPAENLVVRLAEKRGDVINVEREICSAFGWDFAGNGRMESLNELMEAVRSEQAAPRGQGGREKTGF